MKEETVADDRVVLINQQNKFIAMDQVKCLAFKKAIQSMKRGEISRFTVSQDFLNENEDAGMEQFFESTPWDKTKTFVIDLALISLVKVEDWY